MERTDVVKALECCIAEEGCTECPRFLSLWGCSRQNMTDALALIREQAEENEFHRKTISKNAQMALNVTVDEIEKTKADTVQKYREKLYRELASLGVKDKFNKEFFLTKADQIAKELLEDGK